MSFSQEHLNETIEITKQIDPNTVEEIDCLFRDIKITREKMLNV